MASKSGIDSPREVGTPVETACKAGIGRGWVTGCKGNWVQV